jgi:hypothetical protein
MVGQDVLQPAQVSLEDGRKMFHYLIFPGPPSGT